MFRSIAKNYIYDLIYKIVLVLSPLIITPYISRVIGAEYIGYYSFANSLLAYFTIFCVLGTDTYAQREIAYYSNDINKVSQIFFEVFLLRIVLTVIVVPIYILFCYRFKGIVFYLLIIHVSYFVSIITNISWLYIAYERFDIILIRNILMKIIFIVMIFAFVKSKEDIYLYAIIVIASAIFSNITLYFSLNKFITYKRYSINFLRHIYPSFKLFFPALCLDLYMHIDKTMLGFLSTPTHTGYYELATKVVIIMITFITSIANVVSPRTAKLFFENNKTKIISYLSFSIDFVLLISIPSMFGFLCFKNDFVILFFGINNSYISNLFTWFAFIFVPMGIKTIIGNQLLLQIKKEFLYSISIIIGLIINILLNSLFIKNFNSVGATFSSLLSEITIILFLTINVKEYVNIKLVLKKNYKKIFTCLLVFLCYKSLINYIRVTPFILIILCLTFILLYIVILFIVKDDTIIYIYSRIVKNRFICNLITQVKSRI